MRILPVLDVMRGEVVRAVGGRRHEYRPIVSRLTDSSRPLDVAEAIRAHFGLGEFYLADLDAIAGGEPAWSLYALLHAQGYRLWVDAGVREAIRGRQLADAGVESVVIGLETVAGPSALEEIVRALGERVVFSLDLRHGEPMGRRHAWEEGNVWAIAERVVGLGVRRLLVLDLARVGLAGGTGTGELCARLSATFPEVEISAGGGVRNRGDLQELRASGVRTALVASALHDGWLTRTDLDGL
jgi:phosphoribosylformimino-5-aminoimidazole carboxamide ribotide isomerase